jgi:diguanylate cyclase (GGDEF)-like protein
VIRVLVVDDEALIRTGFQHILDAADGIETVAAVSGGQALDAVRELHPDVVLLDIRMPDTDGLTVLEGIRRLPAPPVVAMLTTFDTDEYVTAALRAGAAGFLLKDTDPEQLGHLVRTLAAGETVLSSKVTRTVIDGFLSGVDDEPAVRAVAPLTEREREVLVLLAEGLSNSEIGARMYLSAGTVKDHVSAILTKLRVRMCAERGLETLRARAHEEQAALYADTGRFRDAYEEYRAFHALRSSLRSNQREARAHALHAVFQTTEARRDGERFREMAYRDALTGLHNRRYVTEHLPAILDAVAPVSLAIVDLDHFKRINDTLSHDTGDAVLRQVSALLAEAADDEPAVAARLGGEEFLLVLPGIDAAEAVRRCERLRHRIRGYAWRPITGDITVTTSIGLATSHCGDSTMADLLARADENLYAAKRAGRDRVVAGA